LHVISSHPQEGWECAINYWRRRTWV